MSDSGRASGALWLLGAVALSLVAVSAWSWSSGGLVALALDPAVPMAAKVTQVRAAIAAGGPLAALIYVGFTTVEVVVAPLPGIFLYGAGGAIFGGFLGGALALFGNLVGSAIAFAITRSFGRERAAEWLQDSDLGRLERKLSDRGLLVVFLLRLNPLTSSDIVSYAAGLTSMSAGRMLAGTALGLAPLCWLQAYAAEGLLAAYPWLLYPALVAGIGYLAFGGWVVFRVLGRARTEAAGGRSDSGH